MKAPERPPISALPPLRIALLGYRSHPHVGGQGIYLKYLSQALAELGHQVDVISGPPYPELAEPVRLIKLPSLDLYASDNPLKELRWRHLLSYTDTREYLSKLTGGFAEPYTFGRRVYRYLKKRQHQYDVIHDNQCLSWGTLAIDRLAPPLVTTIHHPITQDLAIALEAAKTPLQQSLARRWYDFLKMQTQVAQKLKHVVTVSRCSQKDISEDFNRPIDQIDVIANGVDTSVFKPMGGINKEPFSLISTASSDQPLKGQRFLLEAVAILRDQFPELKLTIIGQLKPNSQTEHLIKKLTLNDCVQFRSGLTTEQLAEAYNLATVAVTPSLYEGFGLPAAEAMACGTAVVSSDGGALPEVVGDAGVLVPAGDSQALATAIAQLLSDPALCQATALNGRTHIEKHFSWSVAAERFTRYYHSLLATANNSPCLPSITPI